MHDRRLRAVVQPGAALAVGNDADRRARLDRRRGSATSAMIRYGLAIVLVHGRIRRPAATGARSRPPAPCAAQRLRRGALPAAAGPRPRSPARPRAAPRVSAFGGGVRRQPLEHEPLRAVARRHLDRVEIALRIDCEVMRPLEVARLRRCAAELIEHLQGLAVEHHDARVAVVGDVEEPLLASGENASPAAERAAGPPVDEHLRRRTCRPA